MSEYYILEDKTAVPCDYDAWRNWRHSNNRTVAKTEVSGLHVSTVFVGMDMGIDETRAQIFETMIFGLPDDEDEYQERCSTWSEAEEMHRAAVEFATAKATPTP